MRRLTRRVRSRRVEVRGRTDPDGSSQSSSEIGEDVGVKVRSDDGVEGLEILSWTIRTVIASTKKGKNQARQFRSSSSRVEEMKRVRT